MGVYIKGMEMPKSCTVCPFENFGDCYGGKVKAIMDIDDYVCAGKRHPKCPLVSVRPHGRLIDADVLRNLCDEPYWCVWLSDIDDAPTIIPAEEE